MDRYYRKLEQKQLAIVITHIFLYFLYLFLKMPQQFWGFILENHSPKKNYYTLIKWRWRGFGTWNLIKFSVVHVLFSSFWSFCIFEDGSNLLFGSSFGFTSGSGVIVIFVSGSIGWRSLIGSAVHSGLEFKKISWNHRKI